MHRYRVFFGIIGSCFVLAGFSELLLSLFSGDIVSDYLGDAIRAWRNPPAAHLLRENPSLSLESLLRHFYGFGSEFLGEVFLGLIFLLLGKVFIRLRESAQRAFSGYRDLYALSSLFLFLYVSNCTYYAYRDVRPILHTSLTDATPVPEKHMGDSNPELYALIVPQFQGATALMFAILFLVAGDISRSHALKTSEVESLKAETELTI